MCLVTVKTLRLQDECGGSQITCTREGALCANATRPRPVELRGQPPPPPGHRRRSEGADGRGGRRRLLRDVGVQGWVSSRLPRAVRGALACGAGRAGCGVGRLTGSSCVSAPTLPAPGCEGLAVSAPSRPARWRTGRVPRRRCSVCLPRQERLLPRRSRHPCNQNHESQRFKDSTRGERN